MEFKDAMKFRSNLGKLLKDELKRAEDALPAPFSWIRFKATYTNIGRSFFSYFEFHLEKLKTDRPGTFLTYLSALNKWRKVSEDFQPIELLDNLHKLENACEKKSTAGIYLRATRSIYNLIRKDFPDYPLWNYRISSRVETHKARTLSLKQLQAFLNVKNITPAQAEARRIFMISFYAGGMNMADILNLKWMDIKEDRIVFTRQKTKLSGVAPNEIPLSEELKHYLGKRNNSEYVIAKLNREGTPVQLRLRAKGFTKNINRRIKKVCEANGIEPFTTYSARHTFASQLKLNGIEIARIGELLGHSSIKTTEAYLRRFDIEKKAEAIKTIKLDIDYERE